MIETHFNNSQEMDAFCQDFFIAIGRYLPAGESAGAIAKLPLPHVLKLAALTRLYTREGCFDPVGLEGCFSRYKELAFHLEACKRAAAERIESSSYAEERRMEALDSPLPRLDRVIVQFQSDRDGLSSYCIGLNQSLQNGLSARAYCETTHHLGKHASYTML